MPPEVQAKRSTPFFTPKPPGVWLPVAWEAPRGALPEKRPAESADGSS
jgi:hypothetical protein